MARVRTAVVVTLLVAASLSACSSSDDSTPPPPSIGGSDTASSAAPSPSQSPSAASAFDDKGHDVVPGKVEARTPDQRAVADGWLAYWRFRLAAYNAADVDVSQLGKVASGDAAGDITGYVRTLQSKGHHTVGDMRIGVSKVKVAHDRATLKSCIENRTTDRTRSGKPAEQLKPFYVVSGTAERASTTWRISSVTIDAQAPCT